MSGAPILAPEAKRLAERGEGRSATGEVLAWDMDCSPRLHAADLDDPESFHRRLVDWIMSQK